MPSSAAYRPSTHSELAMSGRHILEPEPTPRRASASAVVAIAVILVLASLTVVLVQKTRGKSSTAATPRCARTVDLKVLATPALAGPVSEIAKGWSNPSVAGACIRITTSSAENASAERDLVSGASDAQTLWIPDSSAWVQRLKSDLTSGVITSVGVQVYPSLASSPVGVVAVPSRAAALASLGQAGITRAAASGALPIVVPDPVSNSEGLLSLLAMRSLFAGPTAASQQDLIGLVVRLAHTALPSPASGFAELGKNKATLFAASEQDVIQQNKSAQQPVAGVVYPGGGTVSLDFPVVRLNRVGDDPALASAAEAFQRVLRSISGQRVLASAGFRNPAGDPIIGADGIGSLRVSRIAQPTPQQTADILRLWSAASADSHTLAVIDVSGSMGEPAGNGQTKIQVAASAAATAVNYFPDTSSFGLWAFSSDQTANTPWSQRAPLAALGAKSNGVSHRKALVTAAAMLPSLVRGSTALYDTTFAAFEQVRNTYDSAKVNSVVLLTDGMNEYPAGISLSTLLTRLRSLVDAAHPVPIITIGVGDQADIPTLKQISAVTGGKAYAVRNPADVRGVFVDAMLQRECRPNC
jgi:Ca-activated chloride channel family protein